MSQQENLFYQKPNLIDLSSGIIAIRPHPKGAALAVAHNIVRAAGGGEPRDQGAVHINGNDQLEIMDAEKSGGMTWLIVDSDPGKLHIEEPVSVQVNGEHRAQRRRLHTGVHLAIRAACNHFSSFNVNAAEIDDDAAGAIVSGKIDRPVTAEDVSLVDRKMRSQVLQGRPVSASKAKSIEHAEETYGELFRVSDRHAFKGKVRLVVIDGFDANPCAGLHHETSNIGPYEMINESTGLANGEFTVRLRLSPTWMYWFGD